MSPRVQVSWRAAVASFIDQSIDDPDLRDADYPLWARRFREDYESRPDFVEALWGEIVYPALYRCFVDVMSSRRGGVLRLASRPMTAESLSAKLTSRLEGRWGRFFENISPHKSVSVLNMKKDELEVAAQKRTQMAKTHDTLALLWRRLAERLSEEQRVRDRWTESEIDMLYREIRGIRG